MKCPDTFQKPCFIINDWPPTPSSLVLNHNFDFLHLLQDVWDIRGRIRRCIVVFGWRDGAVSEPTVMLQSRISLVKEAREVVVILCEPP